MRPRPPLRYKDAEFKINDVEDTGAGTRMLVKRLG